MDKGKQGSVFASYAGERPTPLMRVDSKKSHMIEENFDDPLISDLAFTYKWTLWEQYEHQDESDYTQTMNKVAWFADAISFWRVWKTIPHSDPKNFFTHVIDGKSYVNFYEINGKEQKVSSLSLFKTGIQPAWEDKMNKDGGEYAIKVKIDEETTNEIWNSLVLDLVSDNFPEHHRICGVRTLDKGKFIKIEMWVDYARKKDWEKSGDQEAHLVEILRKCGLGSQKFDFLAHG